MLLNIAFHHLKASYNIFEKLKFFSQDEFYKEVPLENAVLLQSGTRVEVYTTAEDAEEAILKFFSERSGITVEELKKLFSVIEGRKAAEHLFRLASKIESPVLGETYLPWLIERALKRAESYGKAEDIGEVFRGALSAYERAKRETGIEGSDAPVAAATELLEGVNRAVLLGVGLSGIKLSKALKEVEIYVAHRDQEIAAYAVEEVKGRIIDYSDRKEVIASSDLLICATLASHYRVTPALVSGASGLTIADLSPFANVSPEVASLEGVALLNGRLRKAVEENYKLMKAEVKAVERIIEEELERWGYAG